MCPKWFFGGFWEWRCENIVFWPPKGTTLREYAFVDVSHVKIGSTAWALGPWKDFAYKEERNIKKLSGNFGYMGRSNPWGDLDQMSFVGRYCGRNHVCNISWLSVKGCGCGERGNFAFSHWLDASLLQHWSHYRVTVWYILGDSYTFRPSALPGRPGMWARPPRLGLSIKCCLPSPIARCCPAMLLLLSLFPLHTHKSSLNLYP